MHLKKYINFPIIVKLADKYTSLLLYLVEFNRKKHEKSAKFNLE